MRTLGLLGGMSWESTVSYYQTINRLVGERSGGLHSAPMILWSVDFQEIEDLQSAGRWQEAGRILAAAAARLEGAGAEVLVLCTNTMHRVAPAIEAAVEIPLVHIADATAEAVGQAGMKRVGLLGTRFTMEEEFYRGRLEERHGIEVLVPAADDRRMVDRVIFEELCRGRLVDSSRRAYGDVIQRLVAEGAEGIVLGCTEIALLVGAEDSPVPLFDTAEIHARRAVEVALAESPDLPFAVP